MNQTTILILLAVLVVGGIAIFATRGANTPTQETAMVSPTGVQESAQEDTMPASQDPRNIVETAIKAGTFTTLVQAVQAAGLVETLAGPGPFTVFAPTDEAFAKLPAGTVEALVADPERLKAILTYHVVSGKVMAADVVKLKSATTVAGSEVNITTSGDMVKVNDATVTTADVEASNGVIHIIDTVLMPPQ